MIKNKVLIGFSHCGKSTFGPLLAKQLNRPFWDTDHMLLAETGFTSARTLYQHLGAEAFRAREKAVVQELSTMENAVIATGGGTVLLPENRELLKKNGLFYYLLTPPDVLWERIQKGGIPAYLDPAHPYEDFLKTYAERHALYRSLADEIVDTSQNFKF